MYKVLKKISISPIRIIVYKYIYTLIFKLTQANTLLLLLLLLLSCRHHRRNTHSTPLDTHLIPSLSPPCRLCMREDVQVLLRTMAIRFKKIHNVCRWFWFIDKVYTYSMWHLSIISMLSKLQQSYYRRCDARKRKNIYNILYVLLLYILMPKLLYRFGFGPNFSRLSACHTPTHWTCAHWRHLLRLS